MITYTSHSEQETLSIARDFTQNLFHHTPLPSLILMIGNLGSGKTTFTKGIGSALRVDQVIQSPTYTIIRPYSISDAAIPYRSLIHIDLYRINAPWEVEELGLREYLGTPDTLIIVEWPEKAEDFWKDFSHTTISLTLSDSSTDRTITIVD